jgi:hypothetical protein
MDNALAAIRGTQQPDVFEGQHAAEAILVKDFGMAGMLIWYFAGVSINSPNPCTAPRPAPIPAPSPWPAYRAGSRTA